MRGLTLGLALLAALPGAQIALAQEPAPYLRDLHQQLSRIKKPKAIPGLRYDLYLARCAETNLQIKAQNGFAAEGSDPATAAQALKDSLTAMETGLRDRLANKPALLAALPENQWLSFTLAEGGDEAEAKLQEIPLPALPDPPCAAAPTG